MNKQLIIVIGLPGSGKTTMCQKLQTLNGYIIFDDFINNFYDGELLDTIQSGNKVCINDPRLCQHIIFEKYISIFKKYVNHDNIYLILFENNPNQCIKNVLQRNNNKVGIINTIKNNSKMYSTDNYTKWNHQIISPYSDKNHLDAMNYQC